MPPVWPAQRAHLLPAVPHTAVVVSTTKANWFVADFVELADDDPFVGPIEEVGTPIDLSTTESDLHLRLIDLLRTACELDVQGVRCAIRERRDSVCAACPLSRAGEAGAFGDLCRNGIETERVITMIQVHQVNASAAR